MIGALAILLVYQLVGEILVRTIELPVPGPVLGMLLLFATLLLRGSAPPALTTTAQGLLRHLALLFVPAGVGVIVHLGRVQAEWLPIALILAGGLVLTLLTTALTMRLLLRLSRARA